MAETVVSENIDHTPKVVYYSGKLDFKLGVFEHEEFNRVMVRSHGMDSTGDKVEMTPVSQSDIWFLSQKLGVDPGMRKMVLDSLPRNAMGIVFINHAEGIMCIFHKSIGGYSGADGAVQVTEFYFTIDKNRNSESEIVDFYPLYGAEDYRLAIPVIFSSSVEFYQTFYKSCSEFYEKSDEQFEKLFTRTRTLLNDLVDMRQRIHDKLSEGLMRGAMYFERPTFIMQTIMEAVIRDLTPIERMEIPFSKS